jgi:hypothetical protein
MRTLRVVLSMALAFAMTMPVAGYLKFGAKSDRGQVTVKWQSQPVRYFVADRGAPQVDAEQFRQAVARAFTSWEQLSSASARFEFVGFTGAAPSEEDGMTTLGFEDRPELERVLGATSLLLDDSTGAIVEADIFFNSTFDWSVAPAGEAGRFDLQSTALHEIGHLLGLGHSALGETELRPGGGRRVLAAGSVMFPIAFSPGTIDERELRPDDVAGVSDIYPDGNFREETGGLSGTVTKNGAGVLGAHVVAFNPESGELVGNFSVNDKGEYSMSGLHPGPQILRVEPLDDLEAGDILAEDAKIDLDFKVTYADRAVIVPRGGNAAADIKVNPK